MRGGAEYLQIGTERAVECKRCIVFDNGALHDGEKSVKRKAFYCDVGFKSVLRKIRSFMLKQVKSSRTKIDFSTKKKTE